MRRTARSARADVRVVTAPRRVEVYDVWPSWVPTEVLASLAVHGLGRPWRHQVRAADLAYTGHDVLVATGTGSGKSLAYLVPAASRLVAEPRATALYIAPTKALGHDQLRSAREILGRATDRWTVVDGDTSPEHRDWARGHAQAVFSNPDMIHASMLPGHARWTRFLRGLSFVVVDECHHYRGVFGSHTALVLRRLLRVAHALGARPTVVLSSATVSDATLPEAAAPATLSEAAEPGQLLTGRPASVVDLDDSPRGELHLAVWTPADGTPATVDAARVLACLVRAEARTLAFVASRRGAETLARSARSLLSEEGDRRAERVSPYRSGLLPEQRRAIESGLLSGELLGVASTNALELGIDVSGLDAVVMTGFPGTMASLRQQMGRVGRAGRPALAVLVAREDPLDRYLVRRPELLLGRPVERVVLDPANPYVLAPHLAAAVTELPWGPRDAGLFADPAAEDDALASLAAAGVVRRRASGWYPAWRRHSRTGLRSGGLDKVAIVDAATGQVLGDVERHAAGRTVHEQAVYVHAGAVYQVECLSLDDGVALVTPGDPGWTTHPRTRSTVRVERVNRARAARGVELVLGRVCVTSTVVSYLRRTPDGRILDETPLVLPPSELRTQAVWYALDDDVAQGVGVPSPALPGALHAAEHAAIGMLPLIATCDRWDVGGVSAAAHPDTDGPTVFVYDGSPGGAGIAARGYDAAAHWLLSTTATVEACRCESGCPSCVQSPKCGSANNPLDKAGAVAVLRLVVRALT